MFISHPFLKPRCIAFNSQSCFRYKDSYYEYFYKKNGSTNDVAIHVCLILVRSFATCTCSFSGTRVAPDTCRCSDRGEMCVESPDCFPVQCHPNIALFGSSLASPACPSDNSIKTKRLWCVGTLKLTEEHRSTVLL